MTYVGATFRWPIIAFALVMVTTVVAAQSPAYKVPRTPDGQPDIQGFWTNATYTPLERPTGVIKQYYTPQELEAVLKKAAAGESAQTAPGTTADVHYDFSQFGLDRSQSTFVRSLRTSLIVDPPDGKVPPFSAEGKRRLAAREEEQKKLGGRWDSAESNQLDDRCLIMAGPGPPMMDAAYNSNYHIVQSGGVVMILTEMIHDVRIIPLDPSTGSGSPRAESRGDNRPKLSPAIRLYMGDGRAHWEGNSLVVETTNFTDRTHFGYNNRYNSQQFTLTERFTPVGPNTLQWQVTFNDPEVWTRPFTFVMPLTRDNSQPVFEYACHEGNLGLEHILSAARAEERQR